MKTLPNVDFDISLQAETNIHNPLPEWLRSMRTCFVTRVTIGAHGNEIAFAPDATTTLAEDNKTTGVEVSVSIDKLSPRRSH